MEYEKTIKDAIETIGSAYISLVNDGIKVDTFIDETDEWLRVSYKIRNYYIDKSKIQYVSYVDARNSE